MLLTEDPQMQPVQTPFGVVTFLQVRHRLDTGLSLPGRKILGRQEGLSSRSEWNRKFSIFSHFLFPLMVCQLNSNGLIYSSEMREGGRRRGHLDRREWL